ncbi:MAG: phosphatidylserine decarboxylase family protein [Prevotellaceae bacterium]|jgi:phosphatidylserine decarboxylase|nr:phosphatidylserine decarboxylase family protein [Prevotellaceae bacterium]
MKHIRIHKEGRTILLILLFVLFAFNFLLSLLYAQLNHTFVINMVVSGAIFTFVAYFFRNPTRIVEIDDDSLVVAPADGTVVAIEPTEEHECFGGEKRLQVSIFMSVFNVHANWYPVSGSVTYTAHHNGSHYGAMFPKSSTENERSSVLIETPKGTRLLVRQIAGAIARRIVTYASTGKPCGINEHLGFIKFGSRVDMFFPIDTEVYVEIGDKTVGNETIIARLKE